MQSGLNRSDISLNFEISWEIRQFLDGLVREMLIGYVCEYIFYKLTSLLQEMSTLLFQMLRKSSLGEVCCLQQWKHFIYNVFLYPFGQSHKENPWRKTQEDLLEMFSRLSAFYVAGNITKHRIESSLFKCFY